MTSGTVIKRTVLAQPCGFSGEDNIPLQLPGAIPIWPPTTIDDLRRLAKRIEQKMLKEEAVNSYC